MKTLAPAPADFFPAAQKAHIIDHMNGDHGDAVLRYARHYAGRPDATSARLLDLDPHGLDLLVIENGKEAPIRIPFEKPLEKPEEAHPVLVAMAKAARIALGEPTVDEAKRAAALVQAREVAGDFRRGFRTIVLGTASPEGEPDASVAAAVLGDDGAFFIYVSTLSAHTRNLLNTQRGSVLLIEDEAAAAQLLARKRLTFQCSAALVPRGEDPFKEIMALLKAKFGAVMEHLETMTDFQLLRLAPQRGRLVTGFGQAYDVDPADWSKLSHIGGGHTPSPAKQEVAP